MHALMVEKGWAIYTYEYLYLLYDSTGLLMWSILIIYCIHQRFQLKSEEEIAEMKAQKQKEAAEEEEKKAKRREEMRLKREQQKKEREEREKKEESEKTEDSAPMAKEEL